MRADLLDVVTVYYNPVRWESRNRLTKQFIDHMLDTGVRLTVVECQVGERPFELSDIEHINHVPVRSKTLCWNKESLLRVGISRLDPDWKYVCWSDSDIYFRKHDWAVSAVHALQQYDIIQPWSDAYDLGPNDSHLAAYKSFCHQWWHGKSCVYGIDPQQSNFERRVNGLGLKKSNIWEPVRVAQDKHQTAKHHDPHKPHDPKNPHGPHDPDDPNCCCCCCKDGGRHHHPKDGDDCCCCCCPPPPYYGLVGMHAAQMGAKRPWWKRDGGPHEYPHTGYVWAATRHAMESVGGLFDIAAMGAGDYHMALAMIGYADRSMPSSVNGSYRKHLKEWETRALRDINYNIGYLPGTIEHNFHGSKSNRRYIDRWQIFLEHDFDPDTDIMKNSYGVMELTCRKPRLRHDLDVYLRQRNEDANTI